MKQAAQPSEITSGVNESRFIEHIRELFSSSTVALSELAQNARRAQASKVMFDLSEDGSTMVVTDDGIGIDDFRNLVVIAESGWDQGVMESESPFGIGFASVCFTADRVSVESKGKAISFTTDDLVAKRPIAVVPASFIGGTRVTLRGFKIPSGTATQALENYAKGFLIPIVLNGAELARPHAKEFLTGVETEIGYMQIPGIHNNLLHEFNMRAHVYCQGLPVTADWVTSSYYRNDMSTVIHIDHQQFKPRVPDRDSLIDAKGASERIVNVVKSLMREYLLKQKSMLPAAKFVKLYWRIAEEVDFLEVMNDVPVIPRQKLSELVDDLRIPTEGNSSWSTPRENVTREQVESGEVVLFRPDLLDDPQDDNFARMAFASAKGWMHVDPLPEGHWAERHILDIATMDCQITGNVIAEEHFSGRFVWGQVKLYENLAVTMNGETIPLLEPIAVGRSERNEVDGILVPKGANNPAQVLLQVSTYEDDNERYQETDHDLDIDAFSDLVAVMKGEHPAETLSKCLRHGAAKKRGNLAGKSFTVTFDADGEFVVTTN